VLSTWGWEGNKYGYLRLARKEWIRAVEKRRAALGR
jgi:hypothetical protein